jgi:hypothetical protein
MRQYRQLTDGVRKRVSGPGKFSQESADCPLELPLESASLARRLVEATSAARRDPLLTLVVVSSSSFWPNAHNRKLGWRSLRRLEQGSKRVSVKTQCTLRPIFVEADISVWLIQFGLRRSQRLLMDRREVIVDDREILAGVSLPHCEAI